MLLLPCFMKNKKTPPHPKSQNKQYDLLLSQEFLGNEKKNLMMTALYAPDLLTQVSRQLFVENFVHSCLGFPHLKYSSWCFSCWFLRREPLLNK